MNIKSIPIEEQPERRYSRSKYSFLDEIKDDVVTMLLPAGMDRACLWQACQKRGIVMITRKTSKGKRVWMFRGEL